jgi:phage terminase small subunit
MKLNAKHKLFIEEYINNSYNSAVAYSKVYGITNLKVASAGASRLLVTKEIKEYLDIRIEEVKEKYNITREKIVNKLLRVIEQCENDGDKKNLLKSIEILNKMHGLDANQKIEVEHKGININYIVPGTNEPGNKNIY